MKTNIASSYKKQEVVESHNRPRPDRIWYIKKEWCMNMKFQSNGRVLLFFSVKDFLLHFPDQRSLTMQFFSEMHLCTSVFICYRKKFQLLICRKFCMNISLTYRYFILTWMIDWFVCLFIYLFIYFFVYLLICLFIYQFVY